jgi:hypothetical protein
MTDLKAECAQLRELGRSRPNATSRRIAIEALRSKFESVQVEGGKLLGRWGGRDAVDNLREWLLRGYEKPKAHSVRGQAVNALSQCVTAEDAGWVLDFYFSRPKPDDSFHLVPLICALPSRAWRSRIESECRSTSAARRRAAVFAVARTTFPGKREILRQLRNDPAPDVRSLAAWHYSHETSAV